jgi:hypothetical protein
MQRSHWACAAAGSRASAPAASGGITLRSAMRAASEVFSCARDSCHSPSRARKAATSNATMPQAMRERRLGAAAGAGGAAPAAGEPAARGPGTVE